MFIEKTEEAVCVFWFSKLMHYRKPNAAQLDSPKVGEIEVRAHHRRTQIPAPKLTCTYLPAQRGATVAAAELVEFEGRRRVRVVSPSAGWASISAGDGTVLLEPAGSAAASALATGGV